MNQDLGTSTDATARVPDPPSGAGGQEAPGQGHGSTKPMLLSRAEVEHVANLAQLALTDREKELFREQLSSILDHARRLQQLDTGDIAPTATVLRLENIMRDDEIQPSLPLADALANAPSVESDCFQVPVVLEGDG
jgi:aspartyl-tRNA(Asn)/glutamyl-tRNA(Gln) amidotransferase subunit C